MPRELPRRAEPPYGLWTAGDDCVILHWAWPDGEATPDADPRNAKRYVGHESERACLRVRVPPVAHAPLTPPVVAVDAAVGVNALAMVGSGSGALLASGGSDHTVRVWDVATASCLRTISQPQVVWALAVHHDLWLVAGGGDHYVRVLRRASPSLLDSDWSQTEMLSGHAQSVFGVCVRPPLLVEGRCLLEHRLRG